MRWPALAVVFALSVAATFAVAQPRSVAVALPEVPVAELPPQANATLALIRNGGPFPFERDGVRFGNRERALPNMSRDYYHEYTVRTPGTRSRGARRVVCGGAKSAPEVCYYTDDHYRSFRRIRE